MKLNKELEVQLPIEVDGEESNTLIDVNFQVIYNKNDIDWQIVSIFDLDNEKKISLRDLSLGSLAKIESEVENEVDDNAAKWKKEAEASRKEQSA